MSTLLIRADASAEIGTGHVMRCAALAEAWHEENSRVIFALATGGEGLQARVSAHGAEVVKIGAKAGDKEDADQTVALCRQVNAEWLVLDGFHFSADYHARVRNGTPWFLLLDDRGDRAPYRSDIVLNPNPQASDATYTLRDGKTHLLLGPKYALLRREFLVFRGEPSDVPSKAQQILITFGGADPHNISLLVTKSLQAITDYHLDVTVVAGANNPHRASLEAAVAKSLHKAKLLLNVDNMPDLMANADLAITAGGGTCYELAFMNVPMFLIAMADDHEETIGAYSSAGAAFDAGRFDRLDQRALAKSLQEVIANQELRRQLRFNARRMVDGCGAQRVVQVMHTLSRNQLRGNVSSV